VAVRADVSLNLSRTVQVESGVLAEHVDELQQRNRLITSTTTSSVNDYRSHATRQGGYARVRVSLGRLQVLPGARLDHWQLTNQTTSSPWLQTELALRNRYEDQVTGEQYWGDLDQRHTLNAYGFYRVSRRFTVGAKYRMGTNFPIPGYYSEQGPQYFVSDRRYELRLPSHARLDLRADRAFDWSRKRLTVFVEVINLLNRENVRFNPPRVTSSTRQVTRLSDALVPIVPSAGILIEF
jgi:hypothetical protein